MTLNQARDQLEAALAQITERLESLEPERLRLIAERRSVEAALAALGESQAEATEPVDVESVVKEHTSKYRPLWLFLKDNDQDHLFLSFAEVEKVLGFTLPPSSRRHLPYWYGYHTSSLAQAIRDAGWRARKVDLQGEALQFVRTALPEHGDATLEKRFDYDMIQIHERAKAELGYNAARFLQMVYERGGVETARHLILGAVSDGFKTLWEKGRLDLSVEALILRLEYGGLFTAEERSIARDRLHQHNFRPERAS